MYVCLCVYVCVCFSGTDVVADFRVFPVKEKHLTGSLAWHTHTHTHFCAFVCEHAGTDWLQTHKQSITKICTQNLHTHRRIQTYNTVWAYRGIKTHIHSSRSLSNHSCLIALGTPSFSPSYHSSSTPLFPPVSSLPLFPLRHSLHCLEMIKLLGILRFLACMSALRHTVESCFIYQTFLSDR